LAFEISQNDYISARASVGHDSTGTGKGNR
jgi:hypothetical protein